jgi:hypothetical protein
MAVQTETIDNVFDQAFTCFQKAAESTVRMQQEMFRQWTNFVPGIPKPTADFTGPVQTIQKEWTRILTEQTRKFQETWDKQYKAGMQLLTEAFKAVETRDPEELRKKTEELWNKTFSCFKDLAQTQVTDFQATSAKWIEMMTKGKA